MEINIIHLKQRTDRLNLLKKELFEQRIENYKLWDGIEDKKNPKRGIAKAHKQIIEWACRQEIPNFLNKSDKNLNSD